MITHTIQKIQRGYVLITSLIFLVVLTLVAVTALDLSSMEFKMSSNANLKSRGLEASESLRIIGGEILDAHVYNRGGWPAAIGGTVSDDNFELIIPSGVSILDKDGDTLPDVLSLTNSAGESLFSAATLVTDITYQIDGNGDGDFTDDVDTDADLSIYRLGAFQIRGGPMAMASGYEGVGKGTAGGGTGVVFNLQSRGRSAGGSVTVTSSEYRSVIR
jgi:hypothetical protein